jgi:hypothetical protein
MFSGGSLNANKTFKKILSIGYEFETHDIAKFSLHTNGKTLINSDIILRSLPKKIRAESVAIVGDNYLSVKIPIEDEEEEEEEEEKSKSKSRSKSKSKSRSKSRSKGEEDEDELYRQYMEEYGEDEGSDSEEEESESDEEEDELSEFEREYLEYFEGEDEEEELKKRENDLYMEYFNENRKDDNQEHTKFQITNDIGDGFFGDMLAKDCKDLTISKNHMYFFRTNAGKMYDLKFAESITGDCRTFSGVEYVVTYYKPKQKNANIILETFVDACSRIIDHLGDLQRTRGTLLIAKGKNDYKTVGNLEKTRRIYQKPNTNVFYMETYDDDDWKAGKKPKTFGDFIFIPQMTFRSRAVDAIEITKEILKEDESFKVGRTLIKAHKREYQDAIKVEKMVDAVFAEHNKTAKKKIGMNTVIGRTLKCYVYFIFYKIYFYLQGHVDIFSEKYYLKDFLTFASRHTNADYYVRVKEILAEHYGITDTKDVFDFFYKPQVLKGLYDFEEFKEEEFDESGEFIYGDGLNEKLPKKHENYGDPIYSLSSYFHYFENPASAIYLDWFLASERDAFSTTFPIKNDEILLENRYFKDEVGLLLKNRVNKNIHGTQLNIREMHQLVSALYGEKNAKKMMTLEMNPQTHKFTRKCQPGFKRVTEKFRCVKQKTTRKRKQGSKKKQKKP